MKSSTDKLSPRKIPFENLIISLVLDSSRLFMVKIVYHRFVRVSIAFATFWGYFSNFQCLNEPAMRDGVKTVPVV